jgi:hypothetical protein
MPGYEASVARRAFHPVLTKQDSYHQEALLSIVAFLWRLVVVQCLVQDMGVYLQASTSHFSEDQSEPQNLRSIFLSTL